MPETHWLLAFKILFAFMAVFATVLCLLMWLLWFFGRSGPNELRMCKRWTWYAVSSWLIFLVLAFL